MNRRQWVMAFCAVAIVGGTALTLRWLKDNQKLGPPGVKTSPIPGRINCVVELPEKVLDYQSRWIDADPVATNALPPDTSFGQRLYTAPDGFPVALNVVLMGTDRTSFHKPQYCLTGQGWHIDQTESTTIAMDRPSRYLLPATKLTVARQEMRDNQPVTWRGIYVYWYVTDRALSGDQSGFQRMWWMAKDLLTTGVLQRWAYVTCFVVCQPGQEDLAYERLKRFMAAAVPEFQLTPRAEESPATSRQ
jgi:hypothetical protein